MQHDAITEQTGCTESHQGLFLPKIDRDDGRQKEAEEKNKKKIVPQINNIFRSRNCGLTSSGTQAWGSL